MISGIKLKIIVCDESENFKFILTNLNIEESSNSKIWLNIKISQNSVFNLNSKFR